MELHSVMQVVLEEQVVVELEVALVQTETLELLTLVVVAVVHQDKTV